MPATIHVAYTAPVNPSGSTPLITHSQLWAGLERKVRHAEQFVPIFTDCKVLKEETVEGNKVITRRAFIKDGAMEQIKERYIEEVCTLFAPTKVDFLAKNNLAQNVISDGPSTTDEDLSLTYIFDWKYPEVEAGSADEKQKVDEQRKGGRTAIEMTLKSIRGMIEKGEL